MKFCWMTVKDKSQYRAFQGYCELHIPEQNQISRYRYFQEYNAAASEADRTIN